LKSKLQDADVSAALIKQYETTHGSLKNIISQKDAKIENEQKMAEKISFELLEMEYENSELKKKNSALLQDIGHVKASLVMKEVNMDEASVTWPYPLPLPLP